MAEPLLELRDLTCERDGHALFAPLSMRLDSGTIVQLEGPNGIGKTTLLRAICGLSSGYRGNIMWRGAPRRRDHFAAEALYVGHATGLKGALTAHQNLRWWGALRGLAVEAGLDAALATVGLAGYEEMPCYQLSAGQQRRVALARLLLDSATLWVLDEPFTAIDRHGSTLIEEWLVQHACAGGAVLLTTHQPLALPVPVTRVALRVEEGDA